MHLHIFLSLGGTVARLFVCLVAHLFQKTSLSISLTYLFTYLLTTLVN